MDDTLSAIWANPVYRKLILSIIVLLASMVIRRLLHLLLINRLSDDSPHIYVVHKVTGYAVNALAVLVITGIWLEHLGNLSVALGILGAGLAFALQEVIGSIAGWITILTGRLFTIGDRIKTGGIRGDVVDISVLRTTLMAIGNWLGGDHNTGRIVTVSNAFIFKEPLFSYSRHLHYVWDEVIPPITYESDWQQAVKICHGARSAAKPVSASSPSLPQPESSSPHRLWPSSSFHRPCRRGSLHRLWVDWKRSRYCDP